jgi:hypothetical protein
MVTTGVNFPAGYRAVVLYPGSSEQTTYAFILQDYFDVRTPGKYRLQLDSRVIWIPPGRPPGSLMTTNLPVVQLPPIVAQIEIGGQQ